MKLNEEVKRAIQKCNPSTPYRLSKRMGVSPTAIYNLMKPNAGIRGKTLDKLTKIAQDKRESGHATLPAMMLLLALSSVITPMVASVEHCILCQIIDATRDGSISL